MSRLEDDMLYIIGYIDRLDEKLVDALQDGDILVRSALSIAKMYDHRYGTEVEKKLREAFE